MKKNTYAVMALCAFMGMGLTLPVSAHEDEAEATLGDNAAAVGVTATGSIRARLLENREQNKDVRNKLIEEYKDRKDELEEKYEDRKEAWAEKGEDIDARREALKAELRAKLAERIDVRIEALVLKLEAHRDRLVTLAERIDSRIEKFEEKSIDTTSVRKLLSAAETKIEEADAAIHEVEDYADENEAEIAATSTAAVRTAELKALVKAAETALRTANKALVDTVVALKPGQLRLDAITKASATSTSTR